MKRLSRAQRLAKQISEQQQWIASRGGNILGYITRYGSKDDANHYGDGGEAIYKADTDALRAARAQRITHTGDQVKKLIVLLVLVSLAACSGEGVTAPQGGIHTPPKTFTPPRISTDTSRTAQPRD